MNIEQGQQNRPYAGAARHPDGGTERSGKIRNFFGNAYLVLQAAHRNRERSDAGLGTERGHLRREDLAEETQRRKLCRTPNDKPAQKVRMHQADGIDHHRQQQKLKHGLSALQKSAGGPGDEAQHRIGGEINDDFKDFEDDFSCRVNQPRERPDKLLAFLLRNREISRRDRHAGYNQSRDIVVCKISDDVLGKEIFQYLVKRLCQSGIGTDGTLIQRIKLAEEGCRVAADVQDLTGQQTQQNCERSLKQQPESRPKSETSGIGTPSQTDDA